MHDQVGLDHLFQGGAEGGDQVGRQVGDEAHRVGDHAALAVGQLDRAHGGIERGEQQVLGHHAGAGEAVEQRRLAGVGVADQRHRRQAGLAAAGAIDGARAAHALEVALDPHDALADQAAVDLDLRFAGAAQEAEAAALAFQVGPRPHQAAALVVEGGQFDLQPAFMRAGAGAEDLQDQSGAVDDLGLPGLLEVALLHGRQLVVDDDEADALLLHRGLQALDDALADQRGRGQPAQRRCFGQAHVEVDRPGKAYRLLELGLAVALAARAGRIGAQHGRDRCRPHRVERLALALVLSVLLDVVDQISPLRRLCPRRTAAPA